MRIHKSDSSGADLLHCYENKPLYPKRTERRSQESFRSPIPKKLCVYYSAVFYGLHLWFSTVWFSVYVQFKRKIHIPVKITRQRDGFSAVPFSMLLQHIHFFISYNPNGSAALLIYLLYKRIYVYVYIHVYTYTSRVMETEEALKNFLFFLLMLNNNWFVPL